MDVVFRFSLCDEKMVNKYAYEAAKAVSQNNRFGLQPTSS